MSVENVTIPVAPKLSVAEKAAKLRGKPVGSSKVVVVATPTARVQKAAATKPVKLSRMTARAAKIPLNSTKSTVKTGSKTNTPAKATKGGKADTTHCSICHKPLSRGTSVASGMGDICQHKMKLLPAGTTLEQHYENISLPDVPEGWVKLKDVVVKAKAKGVSTYRFVQAIGGDRMLRKPINKHFKVVIVDAVRYIDPVCLKHLGDLEKK